MHSYQKLAVVALAASAITPALAAPTTERQQNQARAELEDRSFLSTIFSLAAPLVGALPGLLNNINIRDTVTPEEAAAWIKAISELSKRTEPTANHARAELEDRNFFTHFFDTVTSMVEPLVNAAESVAVNMRADTDTPVTQEQETEAWIKAFAELSKRADPATVEELVTAIFGRALNELD